MKSHFLFTLVGLTLIGSALARGSADTEEGLFIAIDRNNTLQPYSLNFTGQSGYFYYIEETEDLTGPWDYFDVPVIGRGAAEIISFPSAPAARFFRLIGTNDRSDVLFSGNFDSDSLNNYDEALLGMNPFLTEGSLTLGGDEDGDGILNEFDAAPYRASVGALSIAITYPANGTTVN